MMEHNICAENALEVDYIIELIFYAFVCQVIWLRSAVEHFQLVSIKFPSLSAAANCCATFHLDHMVPFIFYFVFIHSVIPICNRDRLNKTYTFSIFVRFWCFDLTVCAPHETLWCNGVCWATGKWMLRIDKLEQRKEIS